MISLKSLSAAAVNSANMHAAIIKMRMENGDKLRLKYRNI